MLSYCVYCLCVTYMWPLPTTSLYFTRQLFCYSWCTAKTTSQANIGFTDTLFACTVKIVIVRLCKCIYLLSVQINNVRLCEFLYVFSIKGSKCLALLILKRLVVVKVSTCIKKCVFFIYLRTALLYFITQRVMAISYRLIFGQPDILKRDQ